MHTGWGEEKWVLCKKLKQMKPLQFFSVQLQLNVHNYRRGLPRLSSFNYCAVLPISFNLIIFVSDEPEAEKENEGEREREEGEDVPDEVDGDREVFGRLRDGRNLDGAAVVVVRS